MFSALESAMSECEEIAANIEYVPKSYDDARAYVICQLRSDETQTVIDNVAWALWRKTNG